MVFTGLGLVLAGAGMEIGVQLIRINGSLVVSCLEDKKFTW